MSTPQTARHRSRRRLSVDRRPALTGSLFVTFALLGVVVIRLTGHHTFAWYGTTLGLLLAVKLLLSIAATPRYEPPSEHLNIGLAIPIFNEDVAALRACLRSIEAQTYRPDLVVLVDDCSTDRTASDMAERWASRREYAVYVALPKNVGKRHAQGVAFANYAADIWVTVDSDTILEPDAVYQGLKPFNDPRVMAVTGTVLALNAIEGLLPRLIDVRYANAFLGDRAAQSTLGSVLCACGSLAFYRGEVVRENLNDWLGQTFLGKPATFGDDRRLTRYALDAGKVLLARDALARTAVPQKFNHYIRQQARWGRSFWRESYLMLKDGSPRRVAWWLSLLEVTTTVLFSIGMTTAMIVGPLSGSWHTALGYLGWVAVTAWARSVHLFVVRGRQPWYQTALAFLVAPLYGLLSLFVLVPLRFWSLATLKASAWGTRTSVEFRLAS